MAETKYCSSCSKTKPAGDFIHPRTGKDGATCAECIIKRSAAAKRPAPVDTAATLQLHTTRLDDHEGRIACVEDAVFEDAPLGAPSAPDAGTFTKSQLRRQKRKNKKAARAAARALDSVLIGDDAASDSTELDSLASTHSCVRALIEENRQLTADLWGMRGMRLLLRDPSFLQRVGRGMVGRSRAKSRLAAVRKIQVLVRRRAKCKFVAIVRLQAWVRASLHASLWRKCRRSLVGLQGRARVRKARAICQQKREIKAAVGIGAAWRRYHVLSTTLFGKSSSSTLEDAGCGAFGNQADQGERATRHKRARTQERRARDALRQSTGSRGRQGREYLYESFVQVKLVQVSPRTKELS